MSQRDDDLFEEAVRARKEGEFSKALEIYQQLADDGHVYALLLLAEMHVEGKGTEVDLRKAEELYERAASLGLVEAVLQGAYISRERGDLETYFRSMRKAAAMGSLPAQFRLGYCYAHGHGTPRDSEKALAVVRDAAERGHISAKIYLARQLLARPLNLWGFFQGLIMYPAAIIEGICIVLRNQYDDRVR